ncbi:hypothetical protein ACSNN7_17045 [Micromonospora sp. URMC 105]|uniref:hypothetical protein n=1 Tax=Micromonospora sp. URMC 105 TaxID=3423413 RepID=UPI003F1AE1F5
MNRDDETLVRSLLARAADDLPAGGVPAQTLLAAGERAVRRRRGLAAGAVAGVAAAVLLGSAVLTGGLRPAVTPGDEKSPQPSRSAPTATRGSAPTVAPEALDPRQRMFRLGSLPPNAGHQSYRSDRKMIMASADVPDAISPGGPVEAGPIMAFTGSVMVRMGARGVDVLAEQREPQLGGGPTPPPLPGRPVAPVDGHPAHLWTGDGETVLSWEYAPGGSISVTVRELPRPEAVARQIVAGLIWETTAMTVPFAPVADPPGSVLDGVEVRTFRGRWLSVFAYYAVSTAAGRATGRDVLVGVTDGMYAGDGSDFGDTKLTVAGRPAYAVDGPKGFGAYRVAQVPSCARCVAEVNLESEAGSASVGGRDGALDLAASIRMVEGSDDPAAWRPL